MRSKHALMVTSIARFTTINTRIHIHTLVNKAELRSHSKIAYTFWLAARMCANHVMVFV